MGWASGLPSLLPPALAIKVPFLVGEGEPYFSVLLQTVQCDVFLHAYLHYIYMHMKFFKMFFLHRLAVLRALKTVVD